MAWAIVPAAGRGARFGGGVPKQYLQVAGQPLLGHALDAVLADPRVAGAVVALSAGDGRWPGWTRRHGKPVVACTGGAERAQAQVPEQDEDAENSEPMEVERQTELTPGLGYQGNADLGQNGEDDGEDDPQQ